MGGDPGMVDYKNVSLKALIARAYEMKEYQVTGPDWLDSERFDVLAKTPPDTPGDRVPLMLQTLLAERFKLTGHREQKVMPVYAMVVGKSGFKLKPLEGDPEEQNAHVDQSEGKDDERPDDHVHPGRQPGVDAGSPGGGPD